MTWQYPYDKYAAMETLTYNCGSLRYNHVRSYGLLCIMQLFYLHNTTSFNVSKKKEGIPQKIKICCIFSCNLAHTKTRFAVAFYYKPIRLKVKQN